jgi:hypothetical protein
MSETSDIEVRRERAARNQALFRQVNERIEELSTPSYLIVAKLGTGGSIAEQLDPRRRVC